MFNSFIVYAKIQKKIYYQYFTCNKLYNERDFKAFTVRVTEAYKTFLPTYRV